MKKSIVRAFLLVMFITLFFSADVNAQAVGINETNFPDATFRQYVRNNFDKPNAQGERDGYLGDDEINAVTSINVSYNPYDGATDPEEVDVNKHGDITTLKGIEYFTKLEEINCANNKIEQLNLNDNKQLKRISCGRNSLTTLDLSECTLLEDLDCSNNKLSSIKLGNNTALKRLNCYDNKLSALDMSAYKKLEWMHCGKNQLTSLKITGCAALGDLYCDNNQLTALDVSTNKALVRLYCKNNKITVLDIRNNKDLSILEADKDVKIITGKENASVVQSTDTTAKKAPAHTEVPNWMSKNGDIIALDKNANPIKYTGVVTWRGHYILIANGVLYKKATFYQDKTDGKWRYFVNGVQARNLNTFVFQFGRLWHVTGGVLDTTDGFVRYNGKFVYSYHGMAATSYTGWVKYDKYKCYLVKGVLAKITR